MINGFTISLNRFTEIRYFIFFNIFPNCNSAPKTIKARGVEILEISDNVLYIGFGIFILKRMNTIPNKVAIIKDF